MTANDVSVADFGARARDFFAEALTPAVRAELVEGGSEYVESFHRRVGSDGWIAMQWSEEYGGGGGTKSHGAALQEEAAFAGAPMLASNLGAIVGDALITHASPELVKRFLPGIAAGETVMCLGYSEPEVGSDLASLQTKAVADGDDWIISGSKMWTSLAHVADYMFCACRTDPAESRHKGISLFMVPMEDVGVEPVWTLGGFRTNVTFLDDVRVPGANLVGELNGAWKILMSALDFERAGTCTARVGQTRRVLALMWRCLEEQGELNRAHEARQELAEISAGVAATAELAYRVARMQTDDLACTAESSIAKIAGTELLARATDLAISLVGPTGLLARGAPGAFADGELESELRNAVRFTVTAGTNEIQRNIMARHGLGLGRSSR